MLKKLIKIVKKKYQIDQTQEWYKGPQTYFDSLKDEVDEVEVEIKDNNQVYLEDELWDVLYTYLNLLVWLKKEWKISSLENIITRAEKKFWERIDAIETVPDKLRRDTWKNVKNKQKAENKKEHEQMYSNK